MTNAYFPELGAHGLEAIKDSLRAIREGFGSVEDPYFPYVASALEAYVRGYLGLIVTYRAAGLDDGKYQLLLHRVPPSKQLRRTGGGEIGNDIGSNVGSDFNANSVLVVRHLGDFSDKVIACGKTWSSRIWLLPINLINEDLRQGAVFFGLPLVNNSFQPNDAIRPRVVFVEPDEVQSSCCGGQRLIEGMLQIDNSVSAQVLDLVGHLFNEFELMDLVASFRIFLDHKGQGVVLSISDERLAGSLDVRACPIDSLLGRLECL